MPDKYIQNDLRTSNKLVASNTSVAQFNKYGPPHSRGDSLSNSYDSHSASTSYHSSAGRGRGRGGLSAPASTMYQPGDVRRDPPRMPTSGVRELDIAKDTSYRSFAQSFRQSTALATATPAASPSNYYDYKPPISQQQQQQQQQHMMQAPMRKGMVGRERHDPNDN